MSGAIKSCHFDCSSTAESGSADLGIVATTKNTLWYVDWREQTSARLVSTHMAKINSIRCLEATGEPKYLSTVSDDGSLNIWSVANRERLLQFEVKSPVSRLRIRNRLPTSHLKWN